MIASVCSVRVSDFTIATVPDRLREVGDVWNKEMKRKNSLKPLLERKG